MWRIAFLLLATLPVFARVDRVVIIKIDGLPPRLVEQYATMGAPTPGGDPRGHVRWIQNVFGREGAWFENFYVRGLSVSAPSWSMLDTGRHLAIRGNVEYDRYTLRAYDYLNFFPFYLGYALSDRVDMLGVELLDEHRIPLLIDRFGFTERSQGIQLLQRAVRWQTLKSVVTRAVSRPPRELIDEWATGFSMANAYYRQNEQELIENLKNTEIKYLDYYTGDYDHVSHLTPDPVTQLHAVETLDATVGRIWNAINASPLAATTALVLVSDHGMSTDPEIYSQGFNLVDWFNSPAGGAQHVITNRYPLTEFRLKGYDAFVSEVITPSPHSAYLGGQSASYPTVILDLDGNERASIGLRSNTFNQLHVLLEQLIQNRLPGPIRTAALAAFFKIRDHARAELARDFDALKAELASLDARIAEQQQRAYYYPRKWTPEQKDLGLDKEARRVKSWIESAKLERRAYGEYAAVIGRLLALDPADFDPGKFKVEEVIPRKSLGPPNSPADLLRYVTGPAEEGLALAPDGSLDLERSFRTVNYFTALTGVSVRNNVQKEVGPNPIEMIAVRVPGDQLREALPPEDRGEGDAVWLWRGPARQALVLRRGDALRYIPVAHAAADDRGNLRFERAAWAAGFPLELWEDANLAIASKDRPAWLDQWHSEREWFEAIHRTRYSNGVIGIAEALLDEESASEPDSGSGDLEARYRARKARLRRFDLIAFAAEHWNFNVRGFNPGGNHGSFLRESTHSVLLVAGGRETGIPRGVRIQTPYDSLSVVPTILELLGRTEPNLPGPVMRELLPPRP
jgi:hypothetical protein